MVYVANWKGAIERVEGKKNGSWKIDWLDSQTTFPLSTTIILSLALSMKMRSISIAKIFSGILLLFLTVTGKLW